MLPVAAKPIFEHVFDHDRGGVTSVPGTLVDPNADVRTDATVRGTVDGTEARS